MRVDITCKKGLLRFDFYPEKSDITTTSGNVLLAKQDCSIYLPENWSRQSVHPDVLGLVTALIIYPFCSVNLRLPFGVSRAFHNTFKKVTKKNILPVNDRLNPRISSKLSVPGLAYSGGVDSTAAMMLLPNTTCLFFLDRIVPKGQTTLYKKEAAYFACNELRKRGRKVYMVKSDLEYIRKPAGFPVDVATAIPALLLSDYIGLDSIAFGTVMESAYKIGHIQFSDYAQGTHFNRWGKLFKTVDMPFNQVVAGLSEVGTSKIVLQSPYRLLAQSCIRGDVGKPCLNCVKCFRKLLLEKILLGHKLEDSYLSKLFLFDEASRIITKFPIKHENVMTFITSRYQGEFPLMRLLKRKTRGDILDVSWLEKWYGPSLELLPNKYKNSVKENILQYFETMSLQDEQHATSWDLKGVIASEKYKVYSNEFKNALYRYSEKNKKK